MTLNDRINAFAELGDFIAQFSNNEPTQNSSCSNINALFYDQFEELIKNLYYSNQWFTEANVRLALQSICSMLDKQQLQNWCNLYPELNQTKQIKTIGVVMAGNIPLVGFHDLLCVLITGHHFRGKLSSKDDKLMKFIIKVLCHKQPAFQSLVEFQEGYFKQFDAIIATGSNNSARYFNYYFAKYPSIIRKNRNSLAIITPETTAEELKLLADDMFTYFGLGCRNVSSILLLNRDVQEIIPYFNDYQYISNHNKYQNNYDYNKALLLLNSTPHLDNGFALFREDNRLISPISVIHYQCFTNKNQIIDFVIQNTDKLQCVVSTPIDAAFDTIPFGQTQMPQLTDYADNIDTIQFLISLAL